MRRHSAASDKATGITLVLVAGLLWSFGAAAVRFAPDADAWQYMVYRAIGQILVTSLWCRWRGIAAPARTFLKAGPLVWSASSMVALAAIAYVLALKTTLVANVLLITSSSPLWASAIAALVLGERIDRATALALALGAAGVAVMVGSGISAGNVFGNAMAIASALGFAGYSVALRAEPGRDWTPAMLGYGYVSLASALAGTLLEGKPLVSPPVDMLAGFVHGFVFIGIGFLMFAQGARRVPAGESTILSQTETIFGPLWVWLLFGESPPATTLAGGALLLAAVALKAGVGWGREPR